MASYYTKPYNGPRGRPGYFQANAHRVRFILGQHQTAEPPSNQEQRFLMKDLYPTAFFEVVLK